MPRSALVHLSVANWRALVRDRQKFIFTLIFPFVFIGIFLLINVVSQPDEVAATIEDPTGTVAPVLSQGDLIRVTSPDEVGAPPSEFEVALRAPDGLRGEISVVTSGGIGPGTKVRDRLVEAGANAERVDVVGPDGEEPFEPVRFGIPAVLILAFASLALYGTAIPIIQLRERGTLRLLGVTPLSRMTFLLAQAPARLAIALIQLLVMGTVAALTGFLNVVQLAGLAATLFLGLAMLFSLGYLFAGLLRDSESSSLVLGTLLPIVLFLSGIFLPLQLLPAVLQDISRFIPLTYFGDALRSDLVGFDGEFARWVSYLAMGGTAVIGTLLATRTFRWDQGE